MHCEHVFILVTWEWLFQLNGFEDRTYVCTALQLKLVRRHLCVVLLPGIRINMLEGVNWYIDMPVFGPL
jgi:hypothetical protein